TVERRCLLELRGDGAERAAQDQERERQRDQRVREPEPDARRMVVQAETDEQRRQRDRERDRREEARDDHHAAEWPAARRPARRERGGGEGEGQRRRHRRGGDADAQSDAPPELDGRRDGPEVVERGGVRQPGGRPREALALRRDRLLHDQRERREVEERDRPGRRDEEPTPHRAAPRRRSGRLSATLSSASTVAAAAAPPSLP